MVLLVAACVMLQGAGTPAARVPQDSIESPALRELADLAARDPEAVAKFWARLESTGTPLVESLPGDSTGRLVTFVWRGEDTTRSVAVITPYSLIDIELSRMHHLSATDVWYRSYHMRSDAVMVYRFGPGDSFVPFSRDRNLGARMAEWRPDPLNADRFTFADGTRASALRLAGRSARVAAERLRGRGTVRIDTVSGSREWPDLPVSVYTPGDAARPTESRPLLVLMDGDAYLGLMGVDSILDRFTGTGPGRSPVVVLVPADPTARTAQYDCNPEWSDFLADRLVPWIDDRYRTSRRPEDRIVGGFSLGGLAAACAAVRHPEVFGNVLAQSGSFYRPSSEPELLARRLAAREPLPIRWSISIGLLETASIPSRDPSMLTASRHLRDVLTAKGCSLRYREYFSGHEHIAWALQLPDALGFLLQR